MLTKCSYVLSTKIIYLPWQSTELREEGVRLQAERIYHKLRSNLMGNVMKEYRRTGYIWEQYDDRTGKGKGCKPFTGWSALVVLLMSENY